MNLGIVTPHSLDRGLPSPFNLGAVTAMGGRLFDASNLETVAAQNSLSTSAVKVYTVPPGYYGMFNWFAFNTNGSSNTISTYITDPSQASPTDPTDRWAATAIATVAFNNNGTDVWMPEGWSVWAKASLSGANFFPVMRLIPVRSVDRGGLFTPLIVKSVPTSETLLYQCNGVESYAVGAQTGAVHNTTSGSLTYTTRLKRATDGSTFDINRQVVTANSGVAWAGAVGTSIALMPGDAIYHLASGVGMNISTSFMERQVRGGEPFAPFGLHP